MSWSDALVKYAMVSSPAVDIPSDVHVFHDEHFTVIKDAYPKSSYHHLLLPRSPFPLPSSLPGAPSSLTTAELSSLQRFLTLPKETVLHVLDLMEETLVEVVTSLEDTMRKERGWEGVVDVQMGFHAVPSMRHLHLHVMSSDLVAPALKNKKHYNSFSPGLGFWLPLATVRSWVETGDREAMSLTPAKYEPILKGPLVSHLTGEGFKTIPKLKAHLEGELQKAERKRKQR